MGQEERNDNQLISRMIHECSSCGECLRGCTFLEIHGTPAAIAGRGNAESNLLSALQCSLCGLCDAVCPEALSPSEMFLEMRQKASEMGLVDLKKYSPWINYEKLGGSFLLRRYIIPDGCKTVFFPGCSLPGTKPDAVMSLFSRLREIEPGTGLVLDCCGKISHDLGLHVRFESVFGRISERLKQKGITGILTSCPGCSKIFKKFGEGFEVTSIYEVIAPPDGILPSACLPPVVIHDPCPSRFDGLQQKAVRKLVESCGYIIEEISDHGSTTRCCGQGGMVEACLPGVVKRESMKIAEAAAGRTVITSCAACADTISSVTPAAHLADLLTGRTDFSKSPVSSSGRWFNRLKLRFLSYGKGVAIRKYILILSVVIIISIFFWFDAGRILTLENLKANRQILHDFNSENPVLMALAFVFIYIFQTALALPGATILSLGAGAIFGLWLGTVYAVTAASIGAALAFLFTRYMLREIVLKRFGSRLESINKELEQRGLNYLLFLRLVPVFPFFLINLAAGMTRLPLRTFVIGTFFGIIPGGFVFVNAGASLATINNLSDIASPRVLGAFALLGLFALIPVCYAKLKALKSQ